MAIIPLRAKPILLACVMAFFGAGAPVQGAPGQPASGAGATESGANFVLLDPDALAELKQKAVAGDAELKPAFDALRKRADALLTEKPPTVTDKPDPLPVSGDRHDYMSLARYYWPNPDTANGLPYVNRDGDSNEKGIAMYDAPRLTRMCYAVRDLALAYTLFGDEKYAGGADKYLRVWFLDDATKMNPNLNHGQFVPGATEGRGFGIIETRWLVPLTDAVRLLDGAPGFPTADRDGFRAWMTQYVDWLQTSKLGQDEHNAKNNHGEWYDAQLTGLARYVGRDDIVRSIATEEGPKRIAKQEQPDGSLPAEIARTRSLHYSMFAVDPWMQVARTAAPLGVDLYHWQTDDGRGIRKALEYLAPYLLGEKTWTHEQLGGSNYGDYYAMWRRAGQVYNEPRSTAVADKLKPKSADTNLNLLLGW